MPPLYAGKLLLILKRLPRRNVGETGGRPPFHCLIPRTCTARPYRYYHKINTKGATMEPNYKNPKKYKTAKYPIRQPIYLTYLITILSKIMLIGKNTRWKR